MVHKSRLSSWRRPRVLQNLRINTRRPGQRQRRGYELLERRLALAAVLFVDLDAPGPVHDGSNWTNAYTDLQEALTAANAGDEIWVQEGIYKPTSGTDRHSKFHLKDNVQLYGGFVGNESEKSQRDLVLHKSTLSGDIGTLNDPTDNSYQVVYAERVNSSTVIDGFVITGGYADFQTLDMGSTYEDIGAGMIVILGSPVLSNLEFRDNYAASSGGGVSAISSSLSFTNISFIDNAAHGSGGGLHFLGEASSTLTNTLFFNNTAGHNTSAGMEGGGAAIACHFNCELQINHATFYGNHGSTMGQSISTIDSNVTVDNSIIWNTSDRSDYQLSSDVKVSNSIVLGGWPGDNNSDLDPMFVDVATGNLRLLFGSPAIDSGHDHHTTPFDIAGFRRPQDGNGDDIAKVDRGAYEYLSPDYGDAPSSYHTLLADDGARHVMSNQLRLGAIVDSELDGQPSIAANADDTSGSQDDEDGVAVVESFTIGQSNSIVVTASGSGKLDAWLDLNNDGTWSSPEEQIITSQSVVGGENPFTITIPQTAAGGWTFARFRVSSLGGLSPTGIAPDGEVEDYLVFIDSAPNANAGGPYEVREGGSVVLDARTTTDANYPDDELTYLWDFDDDGEYDDATGQMPVFSAVGRDGPTSVTVNLKVVDEWGEVSLAEATILVLNVAPVVTLLKEISPSIDSSLPGMVTIEATIVDAGITDFHNVSIDWGDSSASNPSIDEHDGMGSLVTMHQYMRGGTYPVTLTITDDDGAETRASLIVQSVGVWFEDDAIEVHGSSQRDMIWVSPVNGAEVQVRADFAVTPAGPTFRQSLTIPAYQLDMIWMLLNDGNDSVTISTKIDIAAYIFAGNGDDYLYGGAADDSIDGGEGNDSINGGPGNDSLSGAVGNDAIWGGAGDDLLLGGDGDDRLRGGSGYDQMYGEGGNDFLISADDIRGDSGQDILHGGDGDDRLFGSAKQDLLIGGKGSDQLRGNSGGDLMMGGFTIYDTNYNSLSSLLMATMNKWNEPTSYQSRVAECRLILQPGTTSYDDGVVDYIWGELSRDWYLADNDRNSRDDDKLYDRVRNETIDLLVDPI